jgi:hypothetical protein
MVCLHTGFAERILSMDRKPDPVPARRLPVLNGRDQRLLDWISASGLAALIADNCAVEAFPSCPGRNPVAPFCRCRALSVQERIPLGSSGGSRRWQTGCASTQDRASC